MSTYVDLQIECQRIWTKTIEVVPVITIRIVHKNIHNSKRQHPKISNSRVLSIKPDTTTNNVSLRCRDYTQLGVGAA